MRWAGVVVALALAGCGGDAESGAEATGGVGAAPGAVVEGGAGGASSKPWNDAATEASGGTQEPAAEAGVPESGPDSEAGSGGRAEAGTDGAAWDAGGPDAQVEPDAAPLTCGALLEALCVGRPCEFVSVTCAAFPRGVAEFRCPPEYTSQTCR